ncbi:hypothetical protein LL965_16375 [Xanthomonas cassavae CFBP 4642]|uniref:Uncharacterized protein n=1 Tax=Xanthomonas cassavae CFBP 4642 TaxID=1219375 RepID=A0ABS8HHF4_9XANT|nr:hypothetical protein [Xanthomonas cassavae]MCC4621581.1 hypothetical protein [Xanthomonas cassavae CFBP 4642]
MRTQGQVVRRAQRLPPAGIETVALLPAAPPHCWECSALSALSLAGQGRRGVIGLRLHECTAQALRSGGSAFLQASRQQLQAGAAALRRYGPWQRLSNGSYWARSSDALLGVLVAAEDAAVWLMWQQPVATQRRHRSWLR